MVSLLELAERCEAAEGPDQDTNDAIYEALGNCRHVEREVKIVDGDEDDDEDFSSIYSICKSCGRQALGTRLGPLYTSSLDAAMTLFPEGYFPVLDADPRGIEVEVQYLNDETDNGLGACVATGGKTIALALCAAALRARDAQRRDND